jgi:hypothetical protein
MMRLLLWLSVMVIPFTSALAQAPVPAPKAAGDRAPLGAYVDGVVMAHMRAQRTPGVTVSVVKDGQQSFAKGYGLAGIAAGREILGDNTLFRIGSVSKTFIWASVMMLFERGQLDLDSDVIVYGSTPGGFCAAIAAAREGASVILLEPTDHVGGVNTGGLSFSDSNQTIRSTMMGLFDEWHRRIEKDYASRGVKLPYKVSVKDQTTWTYEPHVAARVTKQMLDEAKVKVLTRRVLQSVTRKGI